MHIQPFATVATVALPGEAPIRHGQPGSDARLTVLLYLARRPDGATRETLAAVTGLSIDTTARVLTSLREDSRIFCDRIAGNLWFVPAARGTLDGISMAHLRHQSRKQSAGWPAPADSTCTTSTAAPEVEQ